MALPPHQFLELLKRQIEANLQATTATPGMSKEAGLHGVNVSEFISHAEFEKELRERGFKAKTIVHNASPAVLYEQALRNEKGSFITSTGALAVSSGKKTGRSPGDKRVVENISAQGEKLPKEVAETAGEAGKDIWWGKVNMKLPEDSFILNRERAIDYLNTQPILYIVDAYAGWDERYRVKVRVVASRAYHALFMQNMLIMPSEEELNKWKPDFTIYNAGQFPANRLTTGMSSQTSVCCDFVRNEMVILGTEYAGEMKKGVLTLMMWRMPIMGVLPLHSSANVGHDGRVSIFLGLSGTGKTTLSAEPSRDLIGDDEHVWTSDGVFNIEGGCYAKAVGLSHETEPEIFDALKFGAVLENVVFNKITRIVDYNNTSLTENTRAAYPLKYIPNARIPAVVRTHPTAVTLLCCDAFGVLPPVSRLTLDQAQYYFISGYTAKVAGTEQGVTEPTATFSPCFAGPFIVWHPIVYAQMLAQKLHEHGCHAYLLNTGWTGGGHGVGQRIKLKYTRRMVEAINNGELDKASCVNMPLFNLQVPTAIEGVPTEMLQPQNTWADRDAYDKQLKKLAELFRKNFNEYKDKCPAQVVEAGPQ